MVIKNCILYSYNYLSAVVINCLNKILTVNIFKDVQSVFF